MTWEQIAEQIKTKVKTADTARLLWNAASDALGRILSAEGLREGLQNVRAYETNQKVHGSHWPTALEVLGPEEYAARLQAEEPPKPAVRPLERRLLCGCVYDSRNPVQTTKSCGPHHPAGRPIKIKGA